MSSGNTNIDKVSSSEPPPAITHALGGSIGSALSQLLLFPLERVQIELQASLSSLPKQQQNVSELQQQPQEQNSKENEGKLQQHKAQQRQHQMNNKETTCEIASNKLNGTCTSSTSNSSESCPAILTLISSSASSPPCSKQGSDPKQYDNLEQSNKRQQQCKAGINEFNSSSISTKKRHGRSLNNPKLKKKSPLYEIWTTIIDLHQQGELYRGAMPMATTIFISNFIFFYVHAEIKLRFNAQSKSIEQQKHTQSYYPTKNSIAKKQIPSIWKSLFASSLAGVINVLLTNPFWVANMRIIKEGKASDSNSKTVCSHENVDGTKSKSQEQLIKEVSSLRIPNSSSTSDSTITSSKRSKMSKNKKESLISTIKSIIQDEGIKELWNGTFASLLLVSNPAIQHFAYDRLRLHILNYKQTKKQNLYHTDYINISNYSNLSPLEAFLLGAIAKAIATIITYPLQLTQTLLRLQKKRKNALEESYIQSANNPQYKNTADCLIKLYKIGGLKALYAGMKVKLIQTVLKSAFTFLTYEQIMNIIKKAYFIRMRHS